MQHVVGIEEPHALAFARQQVGRKQTRRRAADDVNFCGALYVIQPAIFPGSS